MCEREHEWEELGGFLPLYKLWAGLPMEYEEFRERARIDAESDRWGLPDLRG